jgi:predicted small secreted protein
MKTFSLFVLTTAAALTLSGCGNTLNGAKQDAATDTAKTQQAADQATQAARTDAQKAGQAAAAVPQNAAANALRVPVKTAIDSDIVLRDPRNLISTDGRDHTITLSGHVADASMKERAGEDAQAALRNHPGYTLKNELIVAGAGQ